MSPFSFESLVPGGFNLGFIGSTCTALPLYGSALHSSGGAAAGGQGVQTTLSPELPLSLAAAIVAGPDARTSTAVAVLAVASPALALVIRLLPLLSLAVAAPAPRLLDFTATP